MSQTTKKTYPPKRQKVPAFARYQGTSAWRKYKRKVRAFYAFKDAAATAAA